MKLKKKKNFSLLPDTRLQMQHEPQAKVPGDLQRLLVPDVGDRRVERGELSSSSFFLSSGFRNISLTQKCVKIQGIKASKSALNPISDDLTRGF